MTTLKEAIEAGEAAVETTKKAIQIIGKHTNDDDFSKRMKAIATVDQLRAGLPDLILGLEQMKQELPSE